MAISLAAESWDRAIEVADGFWVIAAQHHMLFTETLPIFNNRTLVFRLRDAGRDVLAVVNGMTVSAIPEVQRLARETGLPVAYDISPGAGHHVTLDVWHDTFPEARVLIPPARIPHMPNGRKLVTLPRVALLDPEDPLPQFRGQLEAVMINGLRGFPDLPTPREGHKPRSMWRWVLRTMGQAKREPADELWLFHVASRTVIGAENLGWWLTPEAHKQLPITMRLAMPVGRVRLVTDVRPVGDRARVAAAWKRILDWPGEALMGYHDALGGSYLGDVRAELGAAVRRAGQAP